jgi:hypothetical protein
VLWADHIRHAAIAAGARPRSGARHPSGRERGPGTTLSSAHPEAPAASAVLGERATTPVPSAASIAAVARAWLDAGAERTGAVPVVLAGLAEPGRAAEVASALGADDTDRLAQALARAAAGRRSTGSALPDDPSPSGTGDHPSTATAHVSADTSGAARAAADDHLARVAGDVRPVLALVADAEGPAAVADLTGTTRVGGLVLLYPWLAQLCTEMGTLHPGLDPAAVRRLTLARLADPTSTPGTAGTTATADVADAADDPLVLLLAGCPEDAPPRGQMRALDHAVQVAEATDRVLTSFASLLPGFEGSSLDYIRDAWVARPGVLDTGRDPVQLLAATSPLDVVLPLLPYPVGLFRLPWTPPITVRFRS